MENTRTRRKAARRIAKRSSEAYKAQHAIDMASRLKRQTYRWITANARVPDVKRSQGMLRFMLHHNLNRVAIKSPWTILTLKRLDKERAQARQAAGVGSDDYVDDWFGPGTDYVPATLTQEEEEEEEEEEDPEIKEHQLLKEASMAKSLANEAAGRRWQDDTDEEEGEEEEEENMVAEVEGDDAEAVEEGGRDLDEGMEEEEDGELTDLDDDKIDLEDMIQKFEL